MARGRKHAQRSAAGARLFEPGDLMLRPTGLARLRALARRPAPPLDERERRREEDRQVMGKLRVWGDELGRRFRLQYARLDAERDGVTGHYGICYEDGVIRIRLRHATTGLLLKESSLVDTLCHELAHLRHMDHSVRFRKLYQRILDTARELGYYRPGPRQPQGPRQLGLFDAGACGVAAARSEDNA